MMGSMSDASLRIREKHEIIFSKAQINYVIGYLETMQSGKLFTMPVHLSKRVSTIRAELQALSDDMDVLITTFEPSNPSG
jgi:hypothetical protein